MKISVSYLSKIDDLDSCLINLDQTTCDYIHCDIMDNIFVSNLTPSVVEKLELSNKPKDIHLMVQDVIKYVDEYKILNPDYITFHLEATDKIDDVINYIKSQNIKVGLSIKPHTSVQELIPYLDKIDLVLVMSVEPGFGGQSFQSESVLKINQLNKLRNQNNYSYVIEVDGGINDTNARICDGADMLVVGSYITKSADYQEQIDKIINNT